jgi:hypothetical protein
MARTAMLTATKIIAYPVKAELVAVRLKFPAFIEIPLRPSHEEKAIVS